MREMNTEIIAIGTELLLGQIANTNAQWMSQELAGIGVNTFHHTVVGDNLERTIEAFETAQKRANIIIVTGGLGPTEDDLTREAFSEMSQIPVVVDKEQLAKIEQFFGEKVLKEIPSNLKQAHTLEGATVIPNAIGMAAGIYLDYQGRKWIFLPGVPREMKQMFADEVIPILKNLNGEMIIESLVLKFIGIGESQIEQELQDIIDSQDNPTIAPLAFNDGVILRLTAKGRLKAEVDKMLQETKATILDRLAPFYYGENEETIEGKVKELLLKKNLRLAAAESLTGGLFANKLISLPGASAVMRGGIVCYDDIVKEKVLGVPAEILQKEGTVSEACAGILAKNVAAKLEADIGISFTGIAGPDPVEGKPVGKVFIGLVDLAGHEEVREYTFKGNRTQIRYRAMLKGYELLFNYLK